MREEGDCLILERTTPKSLLEFDKAKNMTVEAIKEAILELPEAEKIRLAGWLNAQDSAAWDRQIEADFSEGGPGMTLLKNWDAEIKSSEPVALEEFLHEREKRSRSKSLGE